MGQRLVLEVPEDVYESLARTAKRIGGQPESLAVRWLAQVAAGVREDPLEQFIGSFDSGGSDWADRHHRYLGLPSPAEEPGAKREAEREG